MADRSILETFINPHPARDYLIEHEIQEFTSICPRTGQPDFATIRITYVADRSCLELKSLKLYLQTFRSEGIYYEDATNVILEDLTACCVPRWMRVQSNWTVRGGIRSTITAEYGKRGESAPRAT